MLGPNERKQIDLVQVRLSPDLHADIQMAADIMGQSVSAWLRESAVRRLASLEEKDAEEEQVVAKLRGRSRAQTQTRRDLKSMFIEHPSCLCTMVTS